MSDPRFTMVDGVEAATVPPYDSSVLRGDGCFEAVRCYDGRLFRLDDHLDRLERSARALEIPFPSRDDLVGWMEQAGEGDCVVRVVITRGDAVGDRHPHPRCIVIAHGTGERSDSMTLWPVPAPWHPAGRDWELAGVKTISYAPNLAAGRVARARGADDALLLSDEGLVLEGPTFSIGWCRDDLLYTPSLDLGILPSITRAVVLELWPRVVEVVAPLQVLLEADEVMVFSTLREVTPVRRVGEVCFDSGPVASELRHRFAALAGHRSTLDQPR